MFGKGLRYAGSTERVTVAAATPINNLDPFTYAIWYQPTLAVNGQLVTKGTFGGGNRRPAIVQNATGSIGVAIDRTVDLLFTTVTGLVRSGDRVCCIVTVNSSNGAGDTVRIYVAINDGPLIKAPLTTATDGSGAFASDTSAALALFNNSIGTGPSPPGIGLGVILCNKELTFGEAQALAGDFDAPVRGLVGKWDLGQSNGSRVYDLSGFGNAGTVTGGVPTSGAHMGREWASGSGIQRWARKVDAITSSGSGSLTATLGAATLAATGTLPITGSATVTLNSATVSATGSLPIVGALTATLAAATVAGAGSLPITGAATVTLDAATLSATGTIGSFATLAVTLDAATLTATGTLPIVGSATVTLSAATLAGTGALPIVATLTAMLSTATLSATGTGSDTGTSAAYMAASLFHVADTDEIYYTADTDPIYFTATEG